MVKGAGAGAVRGDAGWAGEEGEAGSETCTQMKGGSVILRTAFQRMTSHNQSR